MDYQIPVVTQQTAGGMGRHLCADHRIESSKSSCLRYLPVTRGPSDDHCRGRGAVAQTNERLKRQHALTIPITANLIALMFVSLADLTQDQRGFLELDEDAF